MRNFRYVAVAEAISFLVLLAVAMPLKYTGVTEWGVHILGPIHGVLFIGYIAFALGLMKPAGWTLTQIFWILVGAMVPFGGFVVDGWIARNYPDDLAAQ